MLDMVGATQNTGAETMTGTLNELPCTCGSSDKSVGPHHDWSCQQYARPTTPRFQPTASQAKRIAEEQHRLWVNGSALMEH